MLFHELRHIEPDHCPLAFKEKVSERPGKFRLSNPGRTKENERTERPVRVLQSGPRPPYRVCNRFNGILLAHHPFCQFLMCMDQFFFFTGEQPVNRNPGPLGHNAGNSFFRDFFGKHLPVLLDLCEPFILLNKGAFKINNLTVADLRHTA